MKINKKILASLMVGSMIIPQSLSFADETVETSTPNNEEVNITSTDPNKRIKTKDIKNEVVVVGGKYDFTDNFPQDDVQNIEVISTPDINVIGSGISQVKVTFKDGKYTTLAIETNVVPNQKEADKLNNGKTKETLSEILKTSKQKVIAIQNKEIDYSRAFTKYEKSWKIEVLKSANNKELGLQKAQLRVTDNLGETADVEVDVDVIKDKIASGELTSSNKEEEKEKNKTENAKPQVAGEETKTPELKEVGKVNTPQVAKDAVKGEVVKGEPIKGEIVKTGDSATLGAGIPILGIALSAGSALLFKKKK